MCAKSRKRDNVVVTNDIQKKHKYAYLEPEGKIYYLRNLDFNVLVLHVELEFC